MRSAEGVERLRSDHEAIHSRIDQRWTAILTRANFRILLRKKLGWKSVPHALARQAWFAKKPKREHASLSPALFAEGCLSLGFELRVVV
jgi:hypothetical protein